MTRRLALTLAASLAIATLSGIAHAAEIPKEFRGVWCGTTKGDSNEFVKSRGFCGEEDDLIMEVTAKDYTIEEGGCRVTKVRRLDRQRLAISFRCEYTEDTENNPKTVDTGPSYETWELVGRKLRIKVAKP
jgi:hypothetical protein